MHFLTHRWYVIAALIWSLACSTAVPPLPHPDPTISCPRVNGTYSYPGFQNTAGTCEILKGIGFSDEGIALPIPSRDESVDRGSVPAGGWTLVELANDIQVRQEGCEKLTVSALITWTYPDWTREGVLPYLEKSGEWYRVREGGPLPGHFRVDKRANISIPLEIRFPGDALTWDETTLTYRFRFRAEGFGAGLSRHYFTLSLGKLPDGGLLYRLRHDDVPGGVAEVECRLPPAGGPEEPPSPSE